MSNIRRAALIVVLASSLIGVSQLAMTADEEPPAATWKELLPGLELGLFPSGTRSEHGDSMIRVVRVDPTRMDLVLVSASAGDGVTRTAREWATSSGLVAAINSSMYQVDHLTSTSLMKTAGHTNNGHLSKDNDILAFDRTDKAAAPVRIIDRDCDDFDTISKSYATLVQSIRMVSCDGRNVWAQQDRKWSHAVIGIDGAGRPLLIHARSPWTTHDFIDILRALPLDLQRLQYAEGGPEAQLYVAAGGVKLEAVGSFETGFFESDANLGAWPVPNVIGVRPKSAP